MQVLDQVVAGLIQCRGQIGVGALAEPLGAERLRQRIGFERARYDQNARQPLGARQRRQHVARHRQHESAPLLRREHAGEALLGRLEGLDGDDGPHVVSIDVFQFLACFWPVSGLLLVRC